MIDLIRHFMDGIGKGGYYPLTNAMPHYECRPIPRKQNQRKVRRAKRNARLR